MEDGSDRVISTIVDIIIYNTWKIGIATRGALDGRIMNQTIE